MRKQKTNWWRKLLTFLGLKFAKVLASLKTLVPAIVAAASKITSAILLTGAVSTITNIFSKSLNKLFTKKFLPKVKPNIDVPKVTPKTNQHQRRYSIICIYIKTGGDLTKN